ncbi:unnamed protein product [Cuscuta europaea]|nr:unnamed protein product [Cuscuta europaea]
MMGVINTYLKLKA